MPLKGKVKYMKKKPATNATAKVKYKTKKK